MSNKLLPDPDIHFLKINTKTIDIINKNIFVTKFIYNNKIFF